MATREIVTRIGFRYDRECLEKVLERIRQDMEGRRPTREELVDALMWHYGWYKYQLQLEKVAREATRATEVI